MGGLEHMARFESLPLFPLQLVLYPEQELPLHIFEPRYQELLAYCLDHREPFGIILMDEGKLASVGCTARVRSVVQEYEDGRSDIMVAGEKRFRVQSVNQDRSYLVASTLPLEEPKALSSNALRQRAIAQHLKLTEYLGETIRPTMYGDIAFLSYFLAQRSGLSLQQQQDVLEASSEEKRLRYIVEHLGELLPELQRATDERQKIRSDGHLGAPPRI